MKLQINGKVVSRNPHRGIIRESLAGLDMDRDGEGIAILSHDMMTYMQVGGDQKVGFDAEYQEGDVGKHYRAENDSFSLEEIVNMMSEYVEGDVDWKKYGNWSRITW